MLRHHRLAIPVLAGLVCALTAFVACSDDTGTSNGPEGNDGGGGGADVQPDVPVIITNDKESKQSGKIIRAQTTDEGVPNATVTVAGNKTAITNANGDYEILVPRNTPWSWTVSAEGYYKLIEQELIVKQESIARGNTNLLLTKTADLLAGLLPGRKKEKGFLVVKVNARAPCATEEGSTLTIDPPGEAKVAYFSGPLPDSQQAAIKGGLDFSAAFYNVEVGVPVRVTVKSPSCQQVPFPVEVGDAANSVTYTGNQTTEPGEALAYLRLYIQDPLVKDAGTE